MKYCNTNSKPNNTDTFYWSYVQFDFFTYYCGTFFFSRKFCARNGITMIAFSPFGSPDLPWGEKLPHLLLDPVLTSIAEQKGRSTAQIVLRWLVQRGCAAIPKVIDVLHNHFVTIFVGKFGGQAT